MTLEKVKTDLKHNIIVNIGDGAFFGFGFGFSSFTTIIPLFLATFSSSATLIGLIPAIHTMGWQLPQLLMARRISKMERVKPFVVLMTLNERLPFLGLGILGFFLNKISPVTAVIITFAILIWQGLGAGLTANAWQILIGKVIPGNMRATFFGSQAAASNLLASIAAFAAGVLLEKIQEPYGFIVCFFIAVILYGISWIFLNLTREEPSTVVPDTSATAPFWSDISQILKKDKPFRNFLIGRILFQFGMMAFAFYTVYAVKNLGMSTVSVGLMTSVLMITQVAANPLLGRLADKWSRKWVMVLGAICATLSAFLAAMIHNPGWFSLVFILSGISSTAFWTIGMTFSMEFGEESKRSTYIGMANTLIAPSTIIAPLIGGFIADAAGYPVTFIASALLGIVAIMTLAILVRDPVAIGKINLPEVS